MTRLEVEDDDLFFYRIYLINKKERKHIRLMHTLQLFNLLKNASRLRVRSHPMVAFIFVLLKEKNAEQKQIKHDFHPYDGLNKGP